MSFINKRRSVRPTGNLEHFKMEMERIKPPSYFDEYKNKSTLESLIFKLYHHGLALDALEVPIQELAKEELKQQ